MKKWLQFPKSKMVIFLSVAHTYYFIELILYDDILRHQLTTWPSTLAAVGIILMSYTTLLLAFTLVDALFSKTRWRRTFMNLLFLFLYALATAYFFGAGQSPEYALFHETAKDGFTWGVFEMVRHWLDPTPLVIALLAALFFIYYEFKSRVISRVNYGGNWGLKCGVMALVYVGLVIAPIETRDEFTYFFKSMYNYHFRASYAHLEVPKNTYPFMQSYFTYHQPVAFDEKPHVFLVIVESFNAWAVDAKSPEGEPLTPFFNQLKKEGLFVENFYAHSVLSIKGYGSIFTGAYPAIKGILLRSDLKLKGLPAVFEENGYESRVFYSEMNEGFKHNLKSLGVSAVSELKDFVKPEDKPFSRPSWGYEDHILYKYFFQELDEKQAEKVANQDGRPFFNTLITLYNHCSFNVPEARRMRVSAPNNLKQKFMNSVYLSDQSLKYFFEEIKKRDYLKNPLVIITGDHGFPVGNHGVTQTESGIFQESYKVPFLMVWPGKIKPQHIHPETGVYGHRNIAPTLIDVLGLDVKNHTFIAASMFGKTNKEPVLLVQPYLGIYLQSIRYPYKYMKHMKTGREHVYNIQVDPQENNDIVKTVPETTMAQLRKDIQTLMLNQYAIENNQIFTDKPQPAEGSNP